MRLTVALLPALLLVAAPTAIFAQASALVPDSAARPAIVSPKLLLKIGLNAGRALRYSGYYGAALCAPLSAGAEYRLGSKFTLYGQLDADLRLAPRREVYGDQHFLVPTGALGVGARYYYNQAGRARHNRPSGPFVGNYLALEAHTEVRQRSDASAIVTPSLNALWGLQRRLGRNFLLDFNAGVGLGPVGDSGGSGFHNPPSPVNITTQFNLGIYFGR